MAEADLNLCDLSLGFEGCANCTYKWDFSIRFPRDEQVQRVRKSTKNRITRKIGQVKFNDSFKFVHKKLYPEGLYTGEVQENTRSGFGIMKFHKGVKYYGHWWQDLPHGPGYLSISTTSHYKGCFSQGKFSGYGEYILDQSYSYKGYFENNLKHGHGYEKSAKEEYKGQFLKDQRQGLGKLQVKSGTFKGSFNKGTPVKGKFKASNKSYSYSGSWVNENWEGKGVLKIFTADSPYIQMKGNFKSGYFLSGRLTTPDKANFILTHNRRLF